MTVILTILVLAVIILSVQQFLRNMAKQTALLAALRKSEAVLAEQVDFNRQVFDSSKAHLAVVGPDGVILAINTAWRRFAEENGGGDESIWGVGANYFVPHAEGWNDAALVAEAFEGIRSVQNGQCSFFNLEYPCHVPGNEKRWFVMHVAPLQKKAGTVLISHTNITPLKLLQETLQQQATTDTLTGIFNRRYFLELSQEELKRAVRLKHPLAIALIDIDHFKYINDSYGHSIGDQVLVAFTQICQKNIREIDLFARIGGDEFVVLLPGASRELAHEVMERVRRILELLPIHCGSKPILITISVGIARLASEQESLDELLIRADQALYLAKGKGRNHVSLEQELL